MIFDWGGVLIDEPSQGLSAYCAQELGVEVRRCCEVIESHLSLFGRGETTEAVFWQRVCQELACSMPESESLWSDAFGIVSRPREAMYDLVQALQKHVKTAVLSNTELSAIPHFMAYRSECFDLKNVFL